MTDKKGKDGGCGMVKNSASVLGYAKINLHLDVTGRLEGGYHSVATVMQTISLHDEISVMRSDREGLTLECNVAGIPTDGKNLAVRAAELFCQQVRVRPNAHIVIDKRIPMAAGLAGGSADAAATLLAMNLVYGEPLLIDDLLTLAARLGADVPFCLLGGTAYGKGRGDLLQPLTAMPDCYIAVACGGEGVSTPWAYGLLDRVYDDFLEKSSYRSVPTDALKLALKNGDLSAIASSIYNIFESPVLAERPVAKRVRKQMLEGGAMGAMMSGSGPSVFGIFGDEDDARTTVRRLQEEGIFASVCRPIARKW